MKLYLDSMLWVYSFEGHPDFGPATRAFTGRMRSAHHEFLSSHLILAEVLVLPKRNHALTIPGITHICPPDAGP